MIDYTLLQLSGYSVNVDQSTPLSANISSTATSITVSDSTQIGRGMAEIDSELIFIDSVDRASNTATVVRGYRSTDAVAHTAPARVVMTPMFPRAIVKQAINETVSAVYPNLYSVGATTFTTNGVQTTWALPTGALDVLDVKWLVVGPTLQWNNVRRWNCDSNANVTSWPTGVTINIWDGIPAGRTVNVVYSQQPVQFTNETDLFSVTGLPASSEDVIRLGAMWRLIGMIDNGHFAGLTAEADFASNMRPVGGALNASRFFLQQYQMRLQEETNRLNSLYNVRVHYTA